MFLYLRLFSKQKPPFCSLQSFKLWSIFILKTDEMKRNCWFCSEKWQTLNKSPATRCVSATYRFLLLLSLLTASQTLLLSTVKNTHINCTFVFMLSLKEWFFIEKPGSLVRGVKKVFSTFLLLQFLWIYFFLTHDSQIWNTGSISILKENVLLTWHNLWRKHSSHSATLAMKLSGATEMNFWIILTVISCSVLQFAFSRSKQYCY